MPSRQPSEIRALQASIENADTCGGTGRHQPLGSYPGTPSGRKRRRREPNGLDTRRDEYGSRPAGNPVIVARGTGQHRTFTRVAGDERAKSKGGHTADMFLIAFSAYLPPWTRGHHSSLLIVHWNGRNGRNVRAACLVPSSGSSPLRSQLLPHQRLQGHSWRNVPALTVFIYVRHTELSICLVYAHDVAYASKITKARLPSE